MNESANAAAAEGETPGVFRVGRRPLGLFRYSDGSSDSRRETQQPVFDVQEHIPGEFRPVEVGSETDIETVIVDTGAAPTHQLYQVFCSDGTTETNVSERWIAMATPEAAADISGLFAKVTSQLEAPQGQFLDADLDYGWAWVNVEHHLGVSEPVEVYESATITNWWGESATAWVSASPVGLEVQVEPEAGEDMLHSCDLEGAASKRGCSIRFRHATAISDDGYFYGQVRVLWQFSSNSGKYDGLGPFSTVSNFRTEVGEAMAVSVYGDD